MENIQNNKTYTELYFEGEEDRIGNVDTLEHFMKLDKTDEVIDKCEELMARTFKFARDKGIPVDFLQLTTYIGVLATSEYVKRREYFIKEYCNSEKSYDRDTINKAYDALMCEMDANVSHDYLLVELFLNTLFSGLDTIDMDKYAEDNGIDISEIEECMITGIVNYQKFVRKMKNRGYQVKLSTYEDDECDDVSFDKLIEFLKSQGFDTSIGIIFDTRKKKQTAKQRSLYQK